MSKQPHVICTLAGASFRSADDKDALRQTTIGEKLSLEPDAQNEYDPHAVRVMAGEHHVGFIPRDCNGPIFQRLIDGDTLDAEIIMFESALKPVLEITL